MRAHAFEMLMEFREVQFSEQSQLCIFESVLACLNDTDLPVRIYAAQSLGLLVEYRDIHNAMKPHGRRIILYFVCIPN